MKIAGEIKMIKWGMIPSEPNWNISVGQMVAGREGFRVVEINKEMNDEYLEPFFHIICVKVTREVDQEKLSDPFIWKTYYKRPDEIQYFYPDEQHNYIKA